MDEKQGKAPVSQEKEIARLQEALKQLQFQNQMMLNWVNGALLNVDREGNILTINEVALNDIGWSKTDVVGKSMHEIMHHSQEDGSEYPWEFSPIFAAIEDGSSHHVDGEVFWHKDGTSIHVDYIVCPSRDEQNEVTGAVIIFRNLTAQKLIEAKRINGMKLESIGELSAGIAHEINTPIQFIGNNISFLEESFRDVMEVLGKCKGFCNELAEQELFPDQVTLIKEAIDQADIEYLEEEVPEAFSQTQDGVERVTKLVLGLKGFAHSSNNDVKADTDINLVISNATIVCRNAYKYVADLVFEAGRIPTVKAFGGDIGQVIVNLLVNASHAIEERFKETEERGLIKIVSSVDDNDVVITIEDTGGGIPQNVQARIFDPFFTTKEVGAGSGQGLAISRTIVHEKHGGELSFISEIDKGTTFKVRLPIKEV